MHGSYFPARSDVVEERKRVVRFVGNGVGAPTVKQSSGCTVTRVGAGDYKITYKENPGNYVGPEGVNLQSATMADLKNFDVVFKDYDATNFAVEFTVYNASGVATDLSNVQSLTVAVLFKATSL